MYCGVPMTAPTTVDTCVPSSAAVRPMRARDAEVGDQRHAVDEQDVLGLDVAMDQILLMRVAQRAAISRVKPQRVVQRQLRLAPEPGAQRFARDVGHDEVEQLAGRARVEQRDDVRMIEAGDDLDLAEEALATDRRRQSPASGP